MIEASAVPAVIDHILLLLSDSVPLADVQIVDGLGARDLDSTHLAIADLESWSREVKDLGNRRIEENFAVNFYIRVLDPGNSQKEARDRAFEILAGLDDVGINGAKLSEAIVTVISSLVTVTDFIEIPTNEGAQAYITGAIECSTWVQPES